MSSIDWQTTVARLEAERDEARAERDELRDAEIRRAADCCGMEAENKRLREAINLFLAINADVQAAHDEAWARVRKAQEAAALARAGKRAEADEMIRKLDRRPRVHDFGHTVEDLRNAAQKALAALEGKP